jgi:hypothetical protein
MTAIGKNRCKASANAFELFYSRKNCAPVCIGNSFEFSPADQWQIQD